MYLYISELGLCILNVYHMNSILSMYNISYFFHPPPSLKQTRSFLLGPHLEHSIPRSMKADATLQQGT